MLDESHAILLDSRLILKIGSFNRMSSFERIWRLAISTRYLVGYTLEPIGLAKRFPVISRILPCQIVLSKI